MYTEHSKSYAHGSFRVCMCVCVFVCVFRFAAYAIVCFTQIFQWNSTGSGSTTRLPPCQWSHPEEYIKNNAWVTVNNGVWVTSEAICQWFSRVTKSRVKIIGKSHHEWPKIVIHGNECINLFLTRYLMSWTLNSAKTIIDRWFRRCR